ncbi:hypothetical protein [Thalassobacillus sp. C254]|uniref:hypothetical protein n=1 Tax=Thalassobacillus sp. C254 TaxID=1225341 RepID=UPI0006D14A69|nr:hypothetical protein [Thalassobacillus sp. C254]
MDVQKEQYLREAYKLYKDGKNKKGTLQANSMTREDKSDFHFEKGFIEELEREGLLRIITNKENRIEYTITEKGYQFVNEQ